MATTLPSSVAYTDSLIGNIGHNSATCYGVASNAGTDLEDRRWNHVGSVLYGFACAAGPQTPCSVSPEDFIVPHSGDLELCDRSTVDRLSPTPLVAFSLYSLGHDRKSTLASIAVTFSIRSPQHAATNCSS